jgi:hypothetical protein
VILRTRHNTIAGLLVSLLSVGVLNSTPTFADSSESRDPCIVARIALDIGSGSTKMRSGIVNVCEQKVLFQIAKGKKAIAFKDNLTREGSDGRHFDPEFVQQAARDIKEIFVKVRQETIDKLSNDPKYSAYSYLARKPIEAKGVCTEAFRQALNASEFFDAMRESSYEQPSIPAQKLSQAEEGRLGFMGALVALGDDPTAGAIDATRVVSWDIGGASLQIVGYQGARTESKPWQDYGNRLASNPMRLFTLSKWQNRPQNSSPNPVVTVRGSAQEEEKVLELAQSFASEQLTDLLNEGWFGKRLSANADASSVYGIGGVHGGVLALLRKLPNYKNAKGYTREGLKGLLDQVLFASDDELVKNWGVEKAFVTGTVTNVLLVYSVMKVLDIKKVTVLDVDNTLGTMISPSFWKKVNATALAKDKALVDPTD